MEGINQNYNIELEVLTPLSIGAGAEKDWVNGADFVVHNGYLYKLNLKKMVSYSMDLNLMTSYFANKDSEGLVQFIGSKLEAVSDFIVEIPSNSDLDIKVFVKNQLSGNPFIPGSSLKGALRSILFQYLGGQTKDGKEVFGSSTNGDEFMRCIKISDAEFDSTTLINTKIFNLRQDCGWQGGWKQGEVNTIAQFKPTGFNTLYECLVPPQKGYAKLMLANLLYRNIGLNAYYKRRIDSFQEQLQNETREERCLYLKKNIEALQVLQNTISKKDNALKINQLFEIINKHTQNYLQKEKAFFLKYATDKTDLIIQSIDALLAVIPSDNSFCILKMSAGSGFHSITGDWQFDDYTKAPLDMKRVKEGKVNPKSRKIAVWEDNFSLMGFVKLRCLTPAEYSEVEKQRITKQQETERKRQQLLKEEKDQREAEEKARIEQEERNKRFHQLMEDVKHLIDDEKYEEASLKLQKIKEDFPGYKQTVIDEEYLHFKIDEIQFHRQQQQRQQQAEQNRVANQQQKLEAGLSFLLNKRVDKDEFLITEFSKGVSRVKQFLEKNKDYVITDSDKDSLHQWLTQIPHPTKKTDKQDFGNFDGKSWANIKNWIGDDLAKSWFNQLQQQ